MRNQLYRCLMGQIDWTKVEEEMIMRLLCATKSLLLPGKRYLSKISTWSPFNDIIIQTFIVFTKKINTFFRGFCSQRTGLEKTLFLVVTLILFGSVIVAASLYSVGYNRAITENEGLNYNNINLKIMMMNFKI